MISENWWCAFNIWDLPRAVCSVPQTMTDEEIDALVYGNNSEDSDGDLPRVDIDIYEHFETMPKTTFLELAGEFYVNLRGSWYRRTPTLCCEAIDLQDLFLIVLQHGGHKGVTSSKKWSHVIRSIGIQKHSTSGSFNVRKLYEKYLVEFEQFVTSGQYMARVHQMDSYLE